MDLIERNKAVEAVNKALDRETILLRFVRKIAVDAIKTMPPAKPKPKRGRWMFGKCSLCGNNALFWCMSSGYYASPYCPHCGAEMVGEEEGNE